MTSIFDPNYRSGMRAGAQAPQPQYQQRPDSVFYDPATGHQHAGPLPITYDPSVGHLGGYQALSGPGSFTRSESPQDFYERYGTMALTRQAEAQVDPIYKQTITALNLQDVQNRQGTALSRQALQSEYAHDIAGQNIKRASLAADRARNALQPSFINREYGLDVQAAELGKKEAMDSYNRNLKSLYSDATARGALVTGGTRFHEADLYTQLSRGMEQGDIALGRAGLQKDVSFADLAKANSQLDATAQQLGVDSQYLKDQLNQGLAKLGLKDQTDATQLMLDKASADYTRVDQANKILSALLSGQTPTDLQSLGKNFAKSGRTPVPARVR